MSSRAWATRSGVEGAKPWPPQPGSTARMRTYSRSPSSGSMALTGVLGVMATPRSTPRSGSLALTAPASDGEHPPGLRGTLDVERDQVRARGDERGHLGQWVVHHQVDVLEHRGTHGTHDRGAKGEHRAEDAVHDIHVDQLDALRRDHVRARR